jgi:hypothetical protein
LLADPEASEAEAARPRSEARARPRSFVPDFMEDAQIDTSWRRHLPPAAEKPAPGEAAPTPAARADIAQLIPALRGARSAGAGDGRRSGRGAVFAILAFALVAAAVMALAQNQGAGAAATPAPPSDPAMYVTDGMTSCRAMAFAEAPHVRYLVRGDTVRLVGRQGDWAAISYGGQQCWVPLDLLSSEPVT